MSCPWSPSSSSARPPALYGLDRTQTWWRRKAPRSIARPSERAWSRPCRRSLGKLVWPRISSSSIRAGQVSQAGLAAVPVPSGGVTALAALWALAEAVAGPLTGALFFVGTLFPRLGFFDVYSISLLFCGRSLSSTCQPRIIRSRRQAPSGCWTDCRRGAAAPVKACALPVSRPWPR